MISQKKRVLFKLLVLSALFVPLASPAISNYMSNLRERMFGPPAPQAPAGLREQAREAREAVKLAEAQYKKEVRLTGNPTDATEDRVEQTRKASEWLDAEVEREIKRAQRAIDRARIEKTWAPEYRRWRATGPMLASDMPTYSAKQQADRARDIKIMELTDFVARAPEIEKAWNGTAAQERRGKIFKNYTEARRRLTNESWRPLGWREAAFDNAQAAQGKSDAEYRRATQAVIEVRAAKDELQALESERREEQQLESLTKIIESGQELNRVQQDAWERLQKKAQKKGVPISAGATPVSMPEPVVAKAKLVDTAALKSQIAELEKQEIAAQDRLASTQDEYQKVRWSPSSSRQEIDDAKAAHDDAKEQVSVVFNQLREAKKAAGEGIGTLSPKFTKELEEQQARFTQDYIEKAKATDAERERVAGLTELQKLEESSNRLKSEIAALKAAKSKRELTSQERYRLHEYPSLIKGYEEMIKNERVREAEKTRQAESPIRARLNNRWLGSQSPTATTEQAQQGSETSLTVKTLDE